MKNFPGRTVEEITELAIDLANQNRNKTTGIINKLDLLNSAWRWEAAADVHMYHEGDRLVGRYYSLSTIRNCVVEIAEQLVETGMVNDR